MVYLLCTNKSLRQAIASKYNSLFLKCNQYLDRYKFKNNKIYLSILRFAKFQVKKHITNYWKKIHICHRYLASVWFNITASLSLLLLKQSCSVKPIASTCYLKGLNIWPKLDELLNWKSSWIGSCYYEWVSIKVCWLICKLETIPEVFHIHIFPRKMCMWSDLESNLTQEELCNIFLFSES